MTPKLPLHRGLELAASYRESLVVRRIVSSVSDPITDEAFGRMMNDLGILVALVAMSSRVPAVYMRSEPCALVLVNRLNTVGHQRFSLAHEICHHCYHGDLNTWVCSLSSPASDMHEREANEFAAALLLPAKAVGEVFAASIDQAHEVRRAALQVCTHFRASWQSTVYRLFNLRLIPPAQRDALLELSVTSLAKQYGVRSDVFRTDSPPKMPPEFSELAKSLLGRSAISDQKYASMMSDLEALIECGKEPPEV